MTGAILYCRQQASLSSRGLGHRVLIPATRVRIPMGMPFYFKIKRHPAPGFVTADAAKGLAKQDLNPARRAGSTPKASTEVKRRCTIRRQSRRMRAPERSEGAIPMGDAEAERKASTAGASRNRIMGIPIHYKFIKGAGRSTGAGSSN